MTNRKNLIFWILAICAGILLILIVINMFYGTKGLEYELNQDGKSFSVKGIGTSTDKNIKIPSTYKFKPVTEIKENAFKGYNHIESVKLSNKIKIIGEGAFYGCGRLESIDIPDSVTEINSEAFYGCGNLTDVTLPNNSVTRIYYDAFYNTDAKVIENGIHYIDKWVIDCDENITSAYIKDGTVGIANGAFSNCYKITNLTIPDSLINISGFSLSFNEDFIYNEYNGVKFLGNNLNPYIIAVDCDENQTYVSLPDSVKFIYNKAFSYCDNLININIPEGILSIGSSAFSNCDNLTNITIPDTVVKIYNSAFYSCDNLSTVMLSKNIETIYEETFAYCSNLNSINISENVKVIESEAFYECSNLKTIYMSNVIENIGTRAFYSCENLNDIYFSGTEVEWKAIQKGNNWDYYSNNYNSHKINYSLHYEDVKPIWDFKW